MSFNESQILAVPYSWPHDASLSKETTALVLVDMQRDFCSPGGYLEQQGYDISSMQDLVPRLQQLLEACREAATSIYHTRQGHRSDLSTLFPREAYRTQNNATGLKIGDSGPLGRFLIRGEKGHDTVPELYPISGEPVIDKPGQGAFAHTEFEILLRVKGIKNLIIAGVATDVSISSTMREASDRGFDCLLVSDGTAASHPLLQAAACETVKTEGGVFGATATLQEILKVTGNPGSTGDSGGLSSTKSGETSNDTGVVKTVGKSAAMSTENSATLYVPPSDDSSKKELAGALRPSMTPTEGSIPAFDDNDQSAAFPTGKIDEMTPSESTDMLPAQNSALVQQETTEPASQLSKTTAAQSTIAVAESDDSSAKPLGTTTGPPMESTESSIEPSNETLAGTSGEILGVPSTEKSKLDKPSDASTIEYATPAREEVNTSAAGPTNVMPGAPLEEEVKKENTIVTTASEPTRSVTENLDTSAPGQVNEAQGQLIEERSALNNATAISVSEPAKFAPGDSSIAAATMSTEVSNGPAEANLGGFDGKSNEDPTPAIETAKKVPSGSSSKLDESTAPEASTTEPSSVPTATDSTSAAGRSGPVGGGSQSSVFAQTDTSEPKTTELGRLSDEETSAAAGKSKEEAGQINSSVRELGEQPEGEENNGMPDEQPNPNDASGKSVRETKSGDTNSLAAMSSGVPDDSSIKKPNQTETTETSTSESLTTVDPPGPTNAEPSVKTAVPVEQPSQKTVADSPWAIPAKNSESSTTMPTREDAIEKPTQVPPPDVPTRAITAEATAGGLAIETPPPDPTPQDRIGGSTTGVATQAPGDTSAAQTSVRDSSTEALTGGSKSDAPFEKPTAEPATPRMFMGTSTPMSSAYPVTFQSNPCSTCG